MQRILVCAIFAVIVGATRVRQSKMYVQDLEQLLCTDEMKGDGKCDLPCAYQGDDGGDCTTEALCALWAGDGWCDPLCYSQAFTWDSGDCELCPEGWYGDGICDIGCNDKQNHDGGDCIDCPAEWVGDGYCDDTCMTKEADFDGGDCYFIMNI